MKKHDYKNPEIETSEINIKELLKAAKKRGENRLQPKKIDPVDLINSLDDLQIEILREKLKELTEKKNKTN